MAKKKYLPLYFEWMKTGQLPYGNGLCFEFDISQGGTDEIFNLFKPLYLSGAPAYWAESPSMTRISEINLPNHTFGRAFTPFRQNIVLFMAAMNGEL